MWRDAKAYNAYQAGDLDKLAELCRHSQIAVSFEVQVTNKDSISLELRELSLSASIPPYGDLQLDEIQSIEHLVQHGVETNLRRDWQVQIIASGSTVIFEILGFSSATDGTADHWAHLAQIMDQPQPSILDVTAVVSFEAKISGFFESTQTLESCNIKIDQWQKKEASRRIQITNICE